MEYYGEGSEHTSSPDCKEELKGDLENLAECSSEFNCKCQVESIRKSFSQYQFQDSRNNTFACLRTIGQEDSIFCEFQVFVTFIRYLLNQFCFFFI